MSFIMPKGKSSEIHMGDSIIKSGIMKNYWKVN